MWFILTQFAPDYYRDEGQVEMFHFLAVVNFFDYLSRFYCDDYFSLARCHFHTLPIAAIYMRCAFVLKFKRKFVCDFVWSETSFLFIIFFYSEVCDEQVTPFYFLIPAI